MSPFLKVLLVLQVTQGLTKPQWRPPVLWGWTWTCRPQRWLSSEWSKSIYLVIFFWLFLDFLGLTQLSTRALDTPPRSLLMLTITVSLMVMRRWRPLVPHLQVRENCSTQILLFYILSYIFQATGLFLSPHVLSLEPVSHWLALQRVTLLVFVTSVVAVMRSTQIALRIDRRLARPPTPLVRRPDTLHSQHMLRRQGRPLLWTSLTRLLWRMWSNSVKLRCVFLRRNLEFFLIFSLFCRLSLVFHTISMLATLQTMI